MKQARRKSTRNRLNADGDEFSDGSTKKAKGHSRVGKGGIPQVNPFVEMLKSATVEQAVPLRKIVVLDDTNTLSEAIKVRYNLYVLFFSIFQASHLNWECIWSESHADALYFSY